MGEAAYLRDVKCLIYGYVLQIKKGAYMRNVTAEWLKYVLYYSRYEGFITY